MLPDECPLSARSFVGAGLFVQQWHVLESSLGNFPG